MGEERGEHPVIKALVGHTLMVFHYIILCSLLWSQNSAKGPYLPWTLSDNKGSLMVGRHYLP